MFTSQVYYRRTIIIWGMPSPRGCAFHLTTSWLANVQRQYLTDVSHPRGAPTHQPVDPFPCPVLIFQHVISYAVLLTCSLTKHSFMQTFAYNTTFMRFLNYLNYATNVIMLVYFNLAFHYFHLPEPPKDLTSILNYTKTTFPITRGYLKSHDVHIKKRGEKKPAASGYLKSCDEEVKVKSNVEIDDDVKPKIEIDINGVKPVLVETKKRRSRRPSKKRKSIKKQKKGKKKCGSSDKMDKEKVAKYLCSICNEKKYKYRRNKLRHEKYECITGPQFACGHCGKRYSQKKTLAMHVALKHIKSEKSEDKA